MDEQIRKLVTGGLADWMDGCMFAYNLIDSHDEWMNESLEREM